MKLSDTCNSQFLSITESVEISVVMPCLNEAETLEGCIKKARSSFHKGNINGEIVIADNGSTDGSLMIAEQNKVRVVRVAAKGYGRALSAGIKAARGKYVLMGDADGSYDFSDIMPFLKKLREGYGLVMGNRFKGGIQPKAMPFLHRYLGNPMFSFVGRSLFDSQCKDFYCGIRGFTRESFEPMNLQAVGMEFAYEMVIKASLLGMSVTEIPATLSPDGRNRAPHLRTFKDGWRTLRLILLYRPLRTLPQRCKSWRASDPRLKG